MDSNHLRSLLKPSDGVAQTHPGLIPPLFCHNQYDSLAPTRQQRTRILPTPRISHQPQQRTNETAEIQFNPYCAACF
jgi:hypothetical protein